jgi:hypothetical protein
VRPPRWQVRESAQPATARLAATSGAHSYYRLIGQQASQGRHRRDLGRLEALHGGRPPTPLELLGTDTETLRQIGSSRTNARWESGCPERDAVAGLARFLRNHPEPHQATEDLAPDTEREDRLEPGCGDHQTEQNSRRARMPHAK